MKPQERQRDTNHITLTQVVRYGIFLALFLLSVLVVGCGSSAATDTTANMMNPVPTVTIAIGDLQKQSPTPTEAPISCGAWATQTSPTFNNGKTNIGVYGKFTQNVNGNPVGIDQASAVATVLWPDGSTQSLTDTTTADGLATFDISTNNKAFAIDKLTLVTISFSKQGVGNCTVDTSRAAFFTIMPNNKNKHGNGNNNGGNNNGNGNNNGGNNNGNGNNFNGGNNNGNNNNNGNGNNFNGNGGNNNGN